jgi:hypothetical protein
VNATIFLDPHQLQRDVIRLGSVESVYRDLLSRSVLLRSCLDGQSAGPARVCDATCYVDENPVGADLLKVGESLFSLDPLSSQGVQTAIGTALHAAAVVNTTLRSSEDRGMANEFYKRRQREAIAFHVGAATRLYQQVATRYPAEFWQLRAKANVEYQGESNDDNVVRTDIDRDLPSQDRRCQLAHRIRIFPLACIDGDFVVERYAVAHPGRLRPTVFVREVEIAPLLQFFRTPLTLKEARDFWSRTLDSAKIDELLPLDMGSRFD